MLATAPMPPPACRTSPAPYLRYADDAINMPCQASTQWDALAHIFIDDRMYNGFDANLVDVKGAKKLGIENVRDKMVGRGVLLDVARFKGVESLDDGYAITNKDLDTPPAAQGVEIRKGRLRDRGARGHQERCPREEGLDRLCRRRGSGPCLRDLLRIREKTIIAAICADTWGCEVRPNETDEA